MKRTILAGLLAVAGLLASAGDAKAIGWGPGDHPWAYSGPFGYGASGAYWNGQHYGAGFGGGAGPGGATAGYGNFGFGGHWPTAAVSPGSLPALQVTNRRQLKLGFDVSKVGRSGLGAVEVYVTEDDGQTWAKAAGAAEVSLPAPGDAKQRGAVTVALAKDGVRCGYYLVVKSRAGLGKPAPQPGTPPQVRAELDTTLPEVKMYPPEADPGRPNIVVLRWEATDRNLAARPITLEWSQSASGPWSPIGEADMPNAGKYSWQIDGKVPPQVYLKVTVRDAAGNSTVAQTLKPVPIDVAEPELSNVAIEPAG